MPLDVSQALAISVDLGTAPARTGARASAALRKAAALVEADARSLAPVDTGNLRNSISTDLEGDGRFAVMSATIGPTAAYGVYQEFGTSRMGPQPFMGPAFDRHVPGFTQALSQLGADVL